MSDVALKDVVLRLDRLEEKIGAITVAPKIRRPVPKNFRRSGLSGNRGGIRKHSTQFRNVFLRSFWLT
jgi:hypothetical protein